jgi:hypothetical protein
LPLRLTEAQRARLLCVAVAPPPVVGPPHAVATMCGRVNLDSHIFTIVNRFDVVPRLSYRSVTRLSRQLDVVDSLPLSLSERFEIMRTGDASKLRSVLTPAALAALSFAPTYGPEDEAHQEVSTPGKIFFKDEHDGWRLQPAAAFRHIVLSSAMVTDHFPDNYVTMFESKITAASTSTESSAAGEAKAGEADKLKHN